MGEQHTHHRHSEQRESSPWVGESEWDANLNLWIFISELLDLLFLDAQLIVHK